MNVTRPVFLFEEFIVFTYRQHAPPWEYVLREVMVFLMMMVVGLERQKARKALGFGPFTLVAVGACSLAILSVILQPGAPSALMGSVVSGISFLGAGALIKGSDGSTQGFTTGSLLVFSAFVGLNIGAGQYVLAGLLYTFLWIIVLIDRYLQTRGYGVHGFKLIVKFSTVAAPIADATAGKATKATGKSVEVQKEEESEDAREAIELVSLRLGDDGEVVVSATHRMSLGLMVVAKVSEVIEMCGAHGDLLNYKISEDKDSPFGVEGELVYQVKSRPVIVNSIIATAGAHLRSVDQDIDFKITGIGITRM